MLEYCDTLEAKLSTVEKLDRDEPLKRLRAFLARAAQAGGLRFQRKWTFGNKDLPELRIDLEVLAGHAAIPDATEGESDV